MISELGNAKRQPLGFKRSSQTVDHVVPEASDGIIHLWRLPNSFRLDVRVDFSFVSKSVTSTESSIPILNNLLQSQTVAGLCMYQLPQENILDRVN